MPINLTLELQEIILDTLNRDQIMDDLLKQKSIEDHNITPYFPRGIIASWRTDDYPADLSASLHRFELQYFSRELGRWQVSQLLSRSQELLSSLNGISLSTASASLTVLSQRIQRPKRGANWLGSLDMRALLQLTT